MPQKYKTSSGSLELACKDNPSLKQVLQGILNWQSNFTDVSGIDPHVPAGTIDGNSLQPPPIVSGLSVEGQNGRFLVNITPPQGVVGVLYYLLQSSLTLPFEASTSLVTYGPTTSTSFDITSPNETRNWQVKARFTNSAYGSSFNINNIYSGVLDSSGLSIGNTKITQVGSTPFLTQSGSGLTINIASSTWQYGGGTIHYNSGSVTVGSYGIYYIYVLDPTKSGGTVSYLASKNASDVASNDGNLLLGVIDIEDVGGGVGGGVNSLGGSAGNPILNPLIVGNGAGTNTEIKINGRNGTNRDIDFQSITLNRWKLRTNSTTEGGSNTGSNFELIACSDLGAQIDSPLVVARFASGPVVVQRPLTVIGPINPIQLQTVVSGSITGSAVFCQIFQGLVFKKVMIYANTLEGTASYTFPVAFTFTPQILSQSLTGIVSSLSTTAITLTGLPSSGFIELSGY